MKVFLQRPYKSLVSDNDFDVELGDSMEESSGADVIVGDLPFFLKSKNSELENYRILVSERNDLSLQELCGAQPTLIAKPTDSQSLAVQLKEFEEKFALKEKAYLATKEIQRKRKELEVLNEQLTHESRIQFESLEVSNTEEMIKNQNEKSLVYFLDFISSESLNDDFVSRILKLIWKEIKKMGYAYQIGFCFENLNETVTLITYNGINERNDTVNLNIQKELNANELANSMGRPIGKIMNWKLTEFSRNGYFFVESIDQQLLGPPLQNYLKERLFTLSLYFDRWLIEKEYHLLIERWDNTFRSFSGYTHVIDENFVIHQSNYLKKTETENHCYKILAGRTEPCVHCPLLPDAASDFYITPQKKVRVTTSDFYHNDKKFHFMLYDDLTNLDMLKSKMIQSEKMATVGRLGNHLSHELNNPLTGLKMYAQLLLQDGSQNLTASLKSDFQEILKATERCEKIIKNLIQFSQQSEIEMVPVSFKDVLESTLTLLKTAMRPHRLFIDLKQDMIRADPTALQQVIFNILKNACQAMENPGSIKIFQMEEKGKSVFCFQDSGPGLSSEVKNLFSPFVTTKKVGEGTGLGLYLSKRLMQRMDAEIKINESFKSGLQIDLVFNKI